jgi:hypothetical protein
MGQITNTCKILVKQLAGKRPPGITLEGNIKMDLGEKKMWGWNMGVAGSGQYPMDIFPGNDVILTGVQNKLYISFQATSARRLHLKQSFLNFGLKYFA